MLAAFDLFDYGASIIPEIPSSTTNASTIMPAKRIYQRVYAS